jgi:hypothetical protein
VLRAAAQSLRKRAAAPHDVGGRMGGLWVLPPWPRTFAYPPHGPCLVPAGGVAADRPEWRSARPASLVPGPALAQLVRGRFRALVHPERPDLTLPTSVRTNGWGVYGKPTVQGPEQVLTSWGRSIHRLALTHSRLRSREDGPISVRSPDSQAPRGQTMTLPADEVIRRFLPHVLPQGFHKVRSYGLWRALSQILRDDRESPAGLRIMQLRVAWAAANDLNPSMGRVTRFTAR